MSKTITLANGHIIHLPEGVPYIESIEISPAPGKPASPGFLRPEDAPAPAPSPPPWNVIVMEDLDFTVRWRLANTSACNVQAFEHTGIEGDDGGGERPIYMVAGATSCQETTPDLDAAQPLIDGGIKWDGCANLEFDNCVHLCGRSSARKFCAVIDRLYVIAKDAMGTRADPEMFADA